MAQQSHLYQWAAQDYWAETSPVIKSRIFKLSDYMKKSNHFVSKLWLEGKLAGKKSKGRQPKQYFKTTQ